MPPDPLGRLPPVARAKNTFCILFSPPISKILRGPCSTGGQTGSTRRLNFWTHMVSLVIDNPKPFAPLFLKSSMLCSVEPVHWIANVKVVVV